MDKCRIWCDDNLSDEYTNGIKTLIELAKHHLDNDNKTCCPCRHCHNVFMEHITVVEHHLWVKGFSWEYQSWIFYGELVIESGVDDLEDI